EGSTVQRPIPPDATSAGLRSPEISQQEAIGDLHLAADAFANAVEAYKSAVASLAHDAIDDRVRLLLRVARAESARGRPREALVEALNARALARRTGNTRLSAKVAAGLAGIHLDLGSPRRAQHYATYAYRVLRDTDEHLVVAQV